MDDDLEQAKKKTEECKVALTDELDTYTLSRFRPSASGRSVRFSANRKIFHHQQMRLIVNDYFNKEEGDAPTMPLSQQAAFPSQTLARTLAEYRELFKKKTEECKAALIDELDTYIQSRFRSSATGRSAHFFANLQSFHRQQILLLIDEFFNSEEDDLPAFPSTTVPSVNQLNVASNPEAAQVDTTSTSPSISPVTPNDQQQLVSSSNVQMKEEPMEEDSSTRLHESNSSTSNDTGNFTATELNSLDSDCDCIDCQADNIQVQAEQTLPRLSVSVNQLDATSNQEAASAQVDTTSTSQSISLTPSDQQQLASSSKVQVNEEPTEEDNSTRRRESISSTTENTVNASATELNSHDSDCDSMDCQADNTCFHAGEESVDSNVDLPENQEDDEAVTDYSMGGDDPSYECPSSSGESFAEVSPKRSRRKAKQSRVAVAQLDTPMKVITKRLKCPQSGCNKMYKDKQKLDDHLKTKHAIEQYRCLVGNCDESFQHQPELNRHHKKHGDLLEWPCGKCSRTFSLYTKLSKHHYNVHEEGRFQCSVDRCNYKSARTRVKVLNHQKIHSFQKFACSVPGCERTYVYQRDLERHLRKHSDHETARCTWPDCTFIATWPSSVIRHIRRVHFKSPNEGNPRAYLEMI